MPLYEAWRTRPSPVQPANSARMTSSGRSQWAFRAAARGGGSANGGVVRGELRDGGQQVRPAAVGEPGADLAGVAQRAALVDADEQRAEVDGFARALRPAADDELLLGPDLDLLPAVGALAGDVRRAAVLGHDPLEAADAGRLEERQPVALDVLAQPDARVRPQDRREQAPSFLERLVEQRAAVEVEQVEDLVDERRRLGGRRPSP